MWYRASQLAAATVVCPNQGTEGGFGLSIKPDTAPSMD
jgi:hypothetical protein